MARRESVVDLQEESSETGNTSEGTRHGDLAGTGDGDLSGSLRLGLGGLASGDDNNGGVGVAGAVTS